jgi:hypothetical protein
MAEHKVITTDAEIETALERAKLHDHEPLAKTVEHIQDLNLLMKPHTSRSKTMSCSDVEPASAFRISMSIYTSQR